MSKKIIGVTVGTPTSLSKIEDEIKPVKTVNGKSPDEKGNVEIDTTGSGGASNLPKVSGEDDGKVLTVFGGEWCAKELPKYDGEYLVTPQTDEDITLQTAQKMLDADIKINKIPYFEVTNNLGGKTATIG